MLIEAKQHTRVINESSMTLL